DTANFRWILIGEKRAQQNSAEKDGARNNHRRPRPAIHKKQNKRKREIELVFDRERPSVREGSAAVESDVLDREQKFPPWIHLRILAPERQQHVDRENHE